MSTEDLIGAWRSDMAEAMCTSTTGGGAKDDGAATEVRAVDANESKETPPEEPMMPIGRGEALWIDYRKWLSRFATQRRSASPSRLW